MAEEARTLSIIMESISLPTPNSVIGSRKPHNQKIKILYQHDESSSFILLLLARRPSSFIIIMHPKLRILTTGDESTNGKIFIACC
jgi:hypothetical protein